MLIDFMLTPTGIKLDKLIIYFTGTSLLANLWTKRDGYKRPLALLLYTRGRKSGKERSAALPCYRIDGKLYIVGSLGGSPKDPQWVDNIRANPHVKIRFNRRTMPMTARIVQGEERARLWEILIREMPTYIEYQGKTTRQIPVVVFE